MQCSCPVCACGLTTIHYCQLQQLQGQICGYSTESPVPAQRSRYSAVAQSVGVVLQLYDLVSCNNCKVKCVTAPLSRRCQPKAAGAAAAEGVLLAVIASHTCIFRSKLWYTATHDRHSTRRTSRSEAVVYFGSTTSHTYGKMVMVLQLRPVLLAVVATL